MSREFDDDEDWEEEEEEDRPRPTGFLTRLRQSGAQLLAGPHVAAEDNPPPSRMQPPEDRVGYAVAAVLVVAGVLIAAVHGKGGAKHPNPLLPILGVVAAAALPVAIMRFRNRFISAILGVLAALLIVFDAKPPNELIGVYYLTVIVGIGWMFWLTRKQSKAARTQLKNQPRATPEARRAARDRRKRGEKEPARSGPAPNRRYTPPQPPKPKRPRGAPIEPAGARGKKADAKKVDGKKVDSKAAEAETRAAGKSLRHRA